MAEYTILEKDIEFIPTAYGNDQEEEPTVFNLKYITDAQRSRCQKVTFDEMGNPQGVELDYEGLIKYGVIGISKLTVNEKDITTARQFNNLSGFQQMHTEVALKIATMNARQDSKNCESRFTYGVKDG